MNKRFLISVAAAALIAGAGVASAQGPGGQAGGAAQQSAPSSGGSSGGAMNHNDASKSGAPANAAGTKAPGGAMQREGGTGPRAQESTPGNAAGKDMKAEGSAGQKGGMNADSRNGASDAKGKSAAENRGAAEGKDNADSKSTADSKGTTDTKGTADNKAGSNTSESKTTGNAATSATAAPPAEKRTQIVSAIKSEKVEEVKNVNFNISVGTRVPSSVHYHSLPSRIVEIYPEWRGYDFILVHGRYIILRPETHEIVYIIEG